LPGGIGDRFTADYAFAGAARLALPALAAVAPLAWLNLRWLARLEFAPAAAAAERRLLAPGGLALPGALVCALAVALGIGVPVIVLAFYAGQGVSAAHIWQEASGALATSATLGLATAALALAAALALEPPRPPPP